MTEIMMYVFILCITLMFILQALYLDFSLESNSNKLSQPDPVPCLFFVNHFYGLMAKSAIQFFFFSYSVFLAKID